MFKDDKQRARVCAQITARIPRGPWWTEDGPSAANVAVAEQVLDAAGDVPAIRSRHWEDALRLSTGEQILVRAAWDFWSGIGHVTLGEVLDRLDTDNARTIADAIRACAEGPRAIELWLGRRPS